MRQFTEEFPEIDRKWFETSNYLVLLSVSNEMELEKLVAKASSKDVRVSIFREPDMDDQLTAVALEPGNKSRKLCSNFKLALSEP